MEDQATGSIAHLACPAAFHDTISAARGKDWVVYAKPPFRGPKQVFEYRSRYTHRIAIGDSRILDFDGETVRFRRRKPKLPGQRKPRHGVESLTAQAFITRFLTHVLPGSFHRICHFGILANGCRRKTLDAARAALGTTNLGPEKHDAADSGAPDKTGGEDAAEPLSCLHCGAPLRYCREIPAGWKGTVSGRDSPRPPAPGAPRP